MFNILLNYIKILIKKPLIFLLKIIVYIEAIFLTPFLIIRFNKIWHNKIIFPFYHHSFGHTILGVDCIARLFFPEKISLIIIPHKSTNKYLIKCFEESYDIYYFNYILIFRSFINPSIIRNKIVKFYLNLIVNFKNDYEIINSFERYYGVLSKTTIPCLAGDENMDKPISYINISGYGRLIENDIGLRPRLPKEYIDLCINKISNQYPNFFDKPFLTLLLRSKAHNSSDFSNGVRNTIQENYIKSIEYAITKDYNIVSTGDTNKSLFKHIEGFFDFSELEIPQQLLNIFLITECKSFIGQQSGPFALASSSGKNCLLIDNWPFRLGSFRKGDICLNKNILINNEYIDIMNLFKNHQDLCLGYGYKRKHVKVIDNNEVEILQSFTEFLNKENSLEIVKLKNLFDVIPQNMPVKYAPSRPPSFILQQLSSL